MFEGDSIYSISVSCFHVQLGLPIVVYMLYFLYTKNWRFFILINSSTLCAIYCASLGNLIYAHI